MNHARLSLLTLLMVIVTPLLFAQAECVHTYRVPGCEGGSECVRREVVPCEVREPSLGGHLKGAVQGAGEALDDMLGREGSEDREPEQRKGTHLGVRG